MPAHVNSRFLGPLLFSLNFLVMMDYLAMVPLVLQIAKTTGLAANHTGLLLSSYPIAAALSSFLLAPFSDRLGRKQTLIILLIGFSMASLGVALSTNVTQIFLFRILSGAFGGPVLPNSFAFASDLFTKKKRSQTIANLSLSFSTASIIGVPLGAWIGVSMGWQWAFGLISLMSFIGVLPLLKVTHRATKAKGSILKQYQELLALWKQTPCRRAFYVQFFMIIGLFGVVPNLAVWLSTNYGYNPNQIALCYMEGGIGSVLGNRLSGYLLHRQFRKGLISLGSIIMALFIGLACSEIVPNPPIGVFFAGIMFGGSLRVPAHHLNLSEILPSQFRGRLMSMNMMISHISMGLGGLWSAPLLHVQDAHLYGMPSIGLIAVLFLSLVPLMVHRFGRATQNLKIN